MIAQESINAVWDAAELVEVVSVFVDLKKRGVNYIGSCPFHNEKTSSFTVSPAKQIFKCFGCGKGGNAVTFLREHEKLSYPEAIHWLADKYNITIDESFTDQEKEDKLVSENIYKINQIATEIFHENLKDDMAVIKYFTEARGFTKETLEKFLVGYAINQDEYLQSCLKSKHLDIRHAINADLVYHNERENRLRDRFQERLMFPIHSMTGRVVGFGGRIWTEEQKTQKLAKYVNTKENEVYHKSNSIYGLYFAKKALSSEDNCFVVEGYADVISLHQGGIENTVASSGTSLTQQQVKIIGRFTKNITFLFDGDAAGVKATARAIQIATEENMNIRLVLFKDGDDPDSYIRVHKSEGLLKYIEENKGDLVDFFIKTGDNSTPEKIDENLKAILEIILIIPEGNFAKVQEYTKKVSAHFKVPEEKILEWLNQMAADKRLGVAGRVTDYKSTSTESPVINHELEYIRVLLLYGTEQFSEGIYCFKFLMEEIGMPEHFKHPVARKIFEQYYKWLTEGIMPTYEDFTKSEDQEIAEMATNMAFDQFAISDNWEGLVVPTDEVLKAVNTAKSYLRLYRLKEMSESNKELLEYETDEDKQIELMKEANAIRYNMRIEADKLGITIYK